MISVSGEVWKMADGEDIQPLVCDNGTGMVKVSDMFFVRVQWFILVAVVMFFAVVGKSKVSCF